MPDIAAFPAARKLRPTIANGGNGRWFPSHRSEYTIEGETGDRFVYSWLTGWCVADGLPNSGRTPDGRRLLFARPSNGTRVALFEELSGAMRNGTAPPPPEAR